MCKKLLVGSYITWARIEVVAFLWQTV